MQSASAQTTLLRCSSRRRDSCVADLSLGGFVVVGGAALDGGGGGLSTSFIGGGGVDLSGDDSTGSISKERSSSETLPEGEDGGFGSVHAVDGVARLSVAVANVVGGVVDVLVVSDVSVEDPASTLGSEGSIFDFFFFFFFEIR